MTSNKKNFCHIYWTDIYLVNVLPEPITDCEIFTSFSRVEVFRNSPVTENYTHDW